MEIGNKLRSRRTELGLSRIELAEQFMSPLLQSQTMKRN